MVQTTPSTDRFVFSSSVAADTWHPHKNAKAYEWWYFDALSDDGSEAIVIVFLDNDIYSPRYDRPDGSNGLSDTVSHRFPTVSFTYYSGGKRVCHTESEFTAADFKASETTPKCSIGSSGFRFESASYGSGYLVSVDLPLSRGRRLQANLEWLSIESDFVPGPECNDDSAHCWNVVAPRSDVSGKITIEDERGRTRESRSFRGTGYHDHNLDNRWLARTVREWLWGRAHFVDSTAVFCRFSQLDGDSTGPKLLLIRDGRLESRDALIEEHGHSRNIHGIRYPERIAIIAADGIRLESKVVKVIDSNFYHLRFLTDMTLTAAGSEHHTTGLTELIAPRALRYRWLNWVSDLRTGKNGRGPRF